ncbi:hypothetical protein HOY80DRAFT_978468, partial [Tuber brumale]
KTPYGYIKEIKENIKHKPIIHIIATRVVNLISVLYCTEWSQESRREGNRGEGRERKDNSVRKIFIDSGRDTKAIQVRGKRPARTWYDGVYGDAEEAAREDYWGQREILCFVGLKLCSGFWVRGLLVASLIHRAHSWQPTRAVFGHPCRPYQR